jgi:hypothetical protein
MLLCRLGFGFHLNKINMDFTNEPTEAGFYWAKGKTSAGLINFWYNLFVEIEGTHPFFNINNIISLSAKEFLRYSSYEVIGDFYNTKIVKPDFVTSSFVPSEIGFYWAESNTYAQTLENSAEEGEEVAHNYNLFLEVYGESPFYTIMSFDLNQMIVNTKITLSDIYSFYPSKIYTPGSGVSNTTGSTVDSPPDIGSFPTDSDGSQETGAVGDSHDTGVQTFI